MSTQELHHYRSAVALLTLLVLTATSMAGDEPPATFRITQEPGALVIQSVDGAEILRYHTQQPIGSRLTVESACYFHPFTTPGGIPLTQVAPMDHPHHRGIFLGWVEMRGEVDADFWGSGTFAPKTNRTIVNREITTMSARENQAQFHARNEWLVQGEPLIIEDLHAVVRAARAAHVLDLSFTLTPTADITLERRAFSGFCVRLPRDGQLDAYSPEGRVTLPNPKPSDPSSNWPAAPWYRYKVELDDGQVAGLVLVDHPQNPPALWHNFRDLRMLNPCIVAPGAVKLKARQPLVLRYRVIAHDGSDPPAPLMVESWP
jgi:hypothetical protein